ncbi:MAG: hypothetical protein ACYDGO_08425 [Smithellaceae bacterium]
MKKFNLVMAFWVVFGLVIGASFSQAADLNGTWNLSVTSPMGSGTPVFKLKQAGNKLSGDYKGTFGEAPVKGSVEGSSFTMKIPQSGQFIVYTGTFSGDTMKGTIDFAGQGNGDFKGTRAAGKAEKAAVKAEKSEVKAEKAAVKAEKAAVKAEESEVKAEQAAVKAKKSAAKKPVKKSTKKTVKKPVKKVVE